MLPGGGAGDPAVALHFKIAAFLTLVDIGLLAFSFVPYLRGGLEGKLEPGLRRLLASGRAGAAV